MILCGGHSSRMGLDKAMLPFGGELMLQRVVRLIAPQVGPIVVVAAADQVLPDLPDSVTIARDRRPGLGPLEGLAAGLSAIKDRTEEDSIEAVYATSCDVPLLVPAFVSRMFELLDNHDIDDYDIVVPRDGKFHHPLAAVYRTSVLPHVEQLLADERMRPAFLFDAVNTRKVPVEELRDVDPDLLTLENLNQREDYLAALRLAGFDPPAELIAKFDR